MRKKFLIVLSIICSFVLLSNTNKVDAAQLAGEKEISKVFPDPVFANYIAQNLNKTVNENVSQQDLNKITAVNLLSTGVKSIEGLQYLNYSADFRLGGNQITDLTPFATWEHLGSMHGYTVFQIWLAANPITDLSPLTILSGISIGRLYIHGIPIDNSQINNLINISKNNSISGYTFSRTHIDDFSNLGSTFVGRLRGYNGITNYGHTVDLGVKKVTSQNDNLVLDNSSLYFDGKTIPVDKGSVTSNGIVSSDDKQVTWTNLNEEKPDSVSFTARKIVNGVETSVVYTAHLEYVSSSSLTVKYVDEAGNKIADPVLKSGNVGDAYSTEQKAIPGYTFKEVQGSASRQFTDQEQTVIYVYTKDPVAGGNVTVKYVDGAGNTLSDNVVKSGNIGDDYSTEQKDIPGYTFKEVQGSASRQFTDQEQTVIYVYTKDPVTPASPEKPVIPDNGKTSSTTHNNMTVNNTTTNNVVKTVKKSAEKMLPKTAAEKVGFSAILAIILAGVTGVVVFKSRRNKQ